MYPHTTPSKTTQTELTIKTKKMDRTQEIKDAHPWLSFEEVVKILIYHHQGSSWIQNLKSDKLQRSMEAFTKLLKSKSRKALEPFVTYVLKEYCNGVGKYGNQIDKYDREESFEHRWKKERAILLKSK